ncbi:hypothetical protein LTS10_011502 [Elasticomyces elasticus]|nr:hypothetical protein LTS10_011502 [Elasticomyces elasticus]
MASRRRTKIERIKVIATKLIEGLQPATTLRELVDLEYTEIRDHDIGHPNGVTTPDKGRILTQCELLIKTFRAMIKEVDESVQGAVDKKVGHLQPVGIEVGTIDFCEFVFEVNDEKTKMRDTIAKGVFEVFLAVLRAVKAD